MPVVANESTIGMQKYSEGYPSGIEYDTAL